MRRLAFLLLLAAAPGAACSSDDDGGPGGGTGMLQVNIAGLPGGTEADVTVTGPGGYSRTLAATTTLEELAAGSYAVTAAPVSVGSDVFGSVVNGSPAAVEAGGTATVAVGYALPGGATPALEPVATGLDFPLYVTAPTGDPRLFIVEKDGRIRVVRDGVLLATPFLDITALTSKGGEQGLLGLAFDPQYATNGRFFVSYTNTDGDNVLASLTRSAASADVADRNSLLVRLTVPQPFSNHNGGHIAFGPDGYLYMGIGDGGSAGDPQGNGQDRTDLLGSLLRLDVRGASGYAIPADNPFTATSGARGELWDWGLRNPWRFAFDRANGDLYIGDVGQGDREEVNVVTAAAGSGRGANYGWAITEGDICYGAASCDRTGLVAPLVAYSHTGGVCSVTGGYVYRGAAIPSLQGTYFYADYCAGWIRSFRLAGGAATDQRDWTGILDAGGSVASFGEDAAGELYVLGGNTVYRLVAR